MILKVLRCLPLSRRLHVQRSASRWEIQMTGECRQARRKVDEGRKKYLLENHRTKPDKNSCDQPEEQRSDDETKKFKYPFENLVLAGGGIKGISYVGLIKVLEEHGISQQIKRYAGTSVGSLVAALLAVGFNSCQIEEILKVDFEKLLYDACRISYLKNFISNYGLNTGNIFYKFLGDILDLKTKPEITFAQLYEQTKKELCIVTVNVDNSEPLYCHVKTTPHMPIRLAVRMSMSIPGLFAPATISQNDTTNHYVDGGLYVNYPVYCYDGWYLSMDKDEKFHKKELKEIMDINNRLRNKPNEIKPQTTIGAVVFSQHENELCSKRMEETSGHTSPKIPLPNTKLAKNYTNATENAKKMTDATGEFLKILARKEDDEITKDEFKTAFNDDSFKENKKVLFGAECDADTAFTAFDRHGKEKITYTELLALIGSTGILAFNTVNDHKRLDTTNFRTYFGSMISGLNSYAGKVNFHRSDVDRTIGISSWYIKTTDFDLEEADIQFLIKEGEGSTRTFLKDYVKKNGASLQERSKEDQIVLPCKNELVGKQIRRILNLL